MTDKAHSAIGGFLGSVEFVEVLKNFLLHVALDTARTHHDALSLHRSGEQKIRSCLA